MTKFNKGTLKKFCTSSIDDIFKLTNAEITTIPGFGRYGFIDNGGDVLAVAHLDVSPSIADLQHRFTSVKQYVASVALDDRLGAYLICDFLPQLGLKYDILLTEGEEIGMSTAAEFKTEKKYNWVFEFDRRGIDVVMYQYETATMRETLIGANFTVGSGSFSDISELEHLGVKAFNFGCGYYREHQATCHANLHHTAKMVDTFKHFFVTYKDTRWDHEPMAHAYSNYLDDDGWEWQYNEKAWEQYNKSWDSSKYIAKPKKIKKSAPSLKEYQNVGLSTRWALEERLRQEYGLEIDDLTWDDYCYIVGVDPIETHSWIELDWAMFRELNAAQYNALDPDGNFQVMYEDQYSFDDDDDPMALADVDINQCLGCGETDKALINGHCESCDIPF